MTQSIRYLKTTDGVRLAWASVGDGPTLVKASNWLTHLEYDWESPVWKHWLQFFADHYQFIRFDERGCGMTEWEVGDLHYQRWVEDLEAVVGVSDPGERFILLGISQGAAAAIDYTVRHPERVSHLILYGGYAEGWFKRGDSDGMRRYQATIDLAELGWGRDNPIFRQLFTGLFMPEGTQEQFDWFNELCRRTTTPANAKALLHARGNVDVTTLLPRVSVPTLVLHADRDELVSMQAGQILASEIPDAEFVPLRSRNHILLQHEPAWDLFMEAVLDFTGRPPVSGAEDKLLAILSDRERDILSGLIEGKTNAQIGDSLFISEKTVRNTLTRIFEKLAVKTRSQAIVKALDLGFKRSL